MLKNINKTVLRNIRPDHRWSSAALLGLLVFALVTTALVPAGVSNASPNAVPQTLTPPSGLLTTGDGTWYWQNNQPQGNIINGLSCPTTTTCYAAGNGGTILKTTDGGTTWTSQNPNSSDNLRGISCFDANTCMTVGENSTIAVTTNGGNSWNRRFFNGLNQTLYSVSCPSSNACYVSGARALLATANRGSSWTVVVQTGDFYGINCPASTACFTVGSAGTIKFTSNAGASWSSQTISPSTGVDLRSVSCVSTLSCYAVGAGGVLIKTTNGTNWTQITGTGISSTLYGISCLDVNNCTAVGGGANASIFTTANAGVSWQAQETYGPTMRAVVCTSTTNCYVGGDNGTLLTRKTALSTWTPKARASNFNFTDVACPTTTYCAAVAGLSLYSSSDGGENWNADATYTLRNNILDVSCIDANNCAAVGYEGYVYYRSGGSWTEGTRLPASTNLYDVDCFLDAATPTCYAVAALGVPGRIFKSTDGGASYTQVYAPVQNSPEDVTFKAVSCPLATTCYAVGANGVILKGSNTTWTSQFDSLGINLSGISCPDANTCFATGENVGDILGTTDGGTTWNLLNSPSGVVSADLNDIDCPSLTVCQAVGNAGILVTTVDGGKNWLTQFRTAGANIITPDVDAISCPTTGFCVGVGASLNSFYSNNADQGWKGQPVGPRWGLTAAACISATTCYVGGTGVSLYTKDSAHWTTLASPTLADINCPTSQDCFAPIGSSSSIYVTHDGGATWSIQSLGGTGLSTISCPSSTVCYGGGNAGNILGYNGSSWAPQTKVVSFDFRGISCPTTGICFAVGFNTNFAYLSGGSWTSKPLGGSYALTSISCPSTDTCYAPTNNGGVLMTKNSGTTWTLKSAIFTSVLTDISCPTTNDCVTTGTNGVIYATRDGGTTWVRHASGTTNPLQAVNCYSVSYCVAVGDNGTLLVGSIIHSLNVTSSSDTGQGTTFGTLSFALKNARPGQTITFDNSVQFSGVTASGNLPQVPYGAGLAGTCTATPKLTIYGNSGMAPLELSGGNTISGVNFRQLGLKTTGTGNKLACTGVNKLPA